MKGKGRQLMEGGKLSNLFSKFTLAQIRARITFERQER